MSSRSKKKRHLREMQNQVPQQQSGRVVGMSHQEMRPAQLSPDVVAKFSNDHVTALVQSFCKSIEYQNETDRLGMKEHYSFQRSGQNKGLVAILSMFLITLGSLYFAGKFDPWYILIAFIVASSVYFVPGIFGAISTMIISLRMKLKNPMPAKKE